MGDYENQVSPQFVEIKKRDPSFPC